MGLQSSYSLSELAEPIPRGWRLPVKPTTEAGRNCALFVALMKWAGSPANIGREVLAVARATNDGLDVPLGDSEVAGLAKSVERYRRSWIAKGRFYTEAERGRGAPQALRLWVESILAVGLTDRANPWPTVLEIPLRELLAKLYPGKRRPKPNEYWPRIMQAVEILDSTRIPWEDPETGKGGLQRIVNILSIPRGPGKLDDAVRIIVDLPPRHRQRTRGESES